MSMRSPTHRVQARAVFAVVLALACHHDVPGKPSGRVRLTHADEAGEPMADEPVTTPAELAYAGCKEVWLEPQPRCLFEPDTPLRLWITHPEGTKVAVRVDGNARPSEPYTEKGMGGFGLKVALPPEANELVVELPEPHPGWTLPLRRWSDGLEAPSGVSTSEDLDEALEQAYESSRQGKHVDALKRLAEAEDLVDRHPKGRADVATYRGLAYWQQGRYHDAATSLAEGVSFAIRLHDPDLINEAIHVYAGVLAELGYWDAAIEWSDQVLTLARDEPDLMSCDALANVMSTVGYAHLLLARHRGERSALARPLLEQALARVGPTGQCPEPSSVPPMVLSLADEALDRGDPQAALDTLAIIDIDTASTADERVRLRDAELRALQGAGRSLDELEQALVRLDREVTEAELPEGRWRLALRRGDLLSQQGRLHEAIEAYSEAEDESLAIAELTAIGVGRESAVALHGQSTERLVGLLAKLGRAEDALCVEREAQARRIQGQGHFLEKAERRDEIDRAIEAYRAARIVLDEAKMGEHALSATDQKALRLEVIRKEQELARMANDILRAQPTWRPTCAYLEPRRPGELLLGLYPASHGWFLFVQDDAGTDLRELPGGPRHALDDPELGAELLDPLTERLVQAQSVRVLASGRAQDVDVHLLRWNDARLIEHVPVTYGAELPRSTSPKGSDGEPIALLVADPTEGLPTAAGEVSLVALWLAAQGWTPHVPTSDEATPTYVRDGLLHASFFYFAGHGVHALQAPPDERSLPPYAGGGPGWPAHLRLKSGTKLVMPDILMLTSAPTHVALLGCETGVPGSAGGGMSLALAFLVAGAEQVVATPIRIGDTTAAMTGLGLLSGISGTTIDLATGLRSAQVAMLRRGDPVDPYRVWVR